MLGDDRCFTSRLAHALRPTRPRYSIRTSCVSCPSRELESCPEALNITASSPRNQKHGSPSRLGSLRNHPRAIPTMAQPLSHLTDPIALGKLQILLVPVHGTSSPRQTIPDSIYLHWSDSIRRHASIRSDELIRPDIAPSHVRGGPSSSPRSRFFPSNTASSVSRANVNQHVHLAYPSHPPAKHLFPLSLLRMTAFPLVVIGIGVAPGHDEGYTVDGEGGDIGEASTPRQSKFPPHQSNVDPMAALEDTLAGLLPPSSAYPLVKRLVLVPPTTPDSPHVYTSPRKAANGFDKGKGRGAGDVRVAPADGGDAWCGRLIAEVVGELLGELGEIVSVTRKTANY